MENNIFLDFQKKIQEDPIIFLDTVLWCWHWDKQDEILCSIFTNQRTTVKSCYWVGKTYIAARIALAFQFAYSDSIVITTAPTFRQVENILWSEIRSAIAKSKISLWGKPLKTRYEIDERWYMLWLSSDEPANFQWFHAPNQLNIADEAWWVKNKSLDALEALMTWEWTKLLYIWNPIIANWLFYDSFKDPTFNHISISVFDTPNFIENNIKSVLDLKKFTKEEILKLPLAYPELVTPMWAWDKIKRWGEETPMFQSKVLAIFPEEWEDTLIKLSYIEQALEKEWNNEEWKSRPRRNAIWIDVARFWWDSTVMIAMDNWKMNEKMIYYNGKDTMVTCWHAISLFNELWFEKEFDIFVVDDTWVGWWVTDRLVELGYNVIPMNNASAPKNTEQFRDIKAEIYWLLRQAFIDWNIKIYDIDRLISDLSNIKYDITSQGKIFIKSKKDMKKEGLDSPDFADALTLAYYGSVIVDGGDVVITWKKTNPEEDEFSIVGNIFWKKF